MNVDGRDDSNNVDGDATVRGSRLWRGAPAGATTLACGFCTAVLGAAPTPTTCRLWKYALRVLWTDATTTPAVVDIEPLQTLAGLIANKMVRYAETKAIFTFAIGCNDSAVYPDEVLQ